MSAKRRPSGGRRLYRLAAWRRLRDAVIARDGGICVMCRLRPCEIVHHIVPIDDTNERDPAVALGPDNVICVCRGCHARLHGGAKQEDVVIMPDGTVRSVHSLTAEDFLGGD
ncbi:MAG: HNH endonuclease [Hydrogenibacillus schlegelii]|nr:HNH endonuclease [Hydrogenibacillus schlegelii]